MATPSMAARTGAYLEGLVDNQYVQDKLLEAAENLRGAYRRASKRRVDPASDKKLRRQIREAIISANEATTALRSGRTRPKGVRAKRVFLALGVATVGIAVAFAYSDDLRNLLFGEQGEAHAGGDIGEAQATPRVAESA